MLMRARRFAGRARSFAKRKVDFVLTGERQLQETREKVGEGNARIRRLRVQVGKRDQEIGRLRAELARERGEDAPDLSGDGAPGMPVFFIVGFAKSGTSWLMRTLNYHPEIFCTGEGLFFGRGTDLDERRGTVAPSSLYGVFADSEYLRAWLAEVGLDQRRRRRRARHQHDPRGHRVRPLPQARQVGQEDRRRQDPLRHRRVHRGDRQHLPGGEGDPHHPRRPGRGRSPPCTICGTTP